MNNRKIIKKYFKEFINILDTKSDDYILNYYINEAKHESSVVGSKEQDNKKDTNVNTENSEEQYKKVTDIDKNASNVFISKNADHIPLPLPRENPDSIYKVGAGGYDVRDATDSRDNAKIDVINIDIDDKNTCYVKNCNSCKNKISYKMNMVNINAEINNISDLIKLCNDYKLAENVEYNIDMKSLHRINDDLVELNNMIGMKTLKENIVDQLLT